MPESCRASKEGQKKIKQAREETQKTIDNPYWLKEASKVINPNWQDNGYFSEGISWGTWSRFLAAKKGINCPAFKAYCQVLKLNWEEVVTNESDPVPSQKIEGLHMVLSGTISNETDVQKVKAYVDHLKQFVEDINLTIQNLKKGSIKIFLTGSQESLEIIEALFKTGQLPQFLGVQVLDVQAKNAPLNWRQWLQNINELLDWQSPQLILAQSANRSITPSDKTLQELVQIWQTTQDEETRWQTSLSIGKIHPNHPLAGIERGKIISLPTEPNPQSFALIAGFVPLPNDQVSIRIAIEPADDEQFYLPPHLKLTIIDDAGQPFIERESGDNDPYLAASFTGPRELQFSATISLENANITEYFLS